MIDPSLRHGYLARRFATLVRGIGFWAAVVLPVAYPLILTLPTSDAPALTLAPPSKPVLIAAAVGVNLLAILLGHGYPDADLDDRRTGT